MASTQVDLTAQAPSEKVYGKRRRSATSELEHKEYHKSGYDEVIIPLPETQRDIATSIRKGQEALKTSRVVLLIV